MIFGRKHVVACRCESGPATTSTLAATLDENRQEVLDEALPKVVESRASIEQAKGALMLVYGISTEQTFNLVRWRSQQTNTKLRALAKQLVAEFHTLAASEPLRSEHRRNLFRCHPRRPPP